LIRCYQTEGTTAYFFSFSKRTTANGLDLKAISIKLKNWNGTEKTTANFLVKMAVDMRHGVQ
jgi:hypothetical protein